MGFVAVLGGTLSTDWGSCSWTRVGRITMGSTARRLRPRLSRVRLVRGVLVDENDGGDDIGTGVHNVFEKKHLVQPITINKPPSLSLATQVTEDCRKYPELDNRRRVSDVRFT